MKLGINCRYDKLLKEETIKILKREGIKFVEICGLPEEINYEELNILKGKFEYSMHASVDGLKINLFPKSGYSKDIIKKIETEIDFAITLNVKEIVVHAGAFFRGYIRLSKIIGRDIGLNYFLDIFAKNFGSILKKADNHGIKVLIENCYPCFLLGRPYDIIYLKQKLPSIGFCLDLAHSEIYNQTEELMKLEIDHIHLTDNNKRVDQHLAIGEGSINFEEFFAKLKAKNYDKKIIFECEDLQDSIKSLNKIKFRSQQYKLNLD